MVVQKPLALTEVLEVDTGFAVEGCVHVVGPVYNLEQGLDDLVDLLFGLTVQSRAPYLAAVVVAEVHEVLEHTHHDLQELVRSSLTCIEYLQNEQPGCMKGIPSERS